MLLGVDLRVGVARDITNGERKSAMRACLVLTSAVCPMRRFIVLFITALAVSGFLPAASASPPIAVLTSQDHGRAQATEAAALAMPAGSELAIASYTLVPGADSGWKHRTGPSVLAVIHGTLTLRSGSGCTLKEYVAGQAVVVPAGLHRLVNAGAQQVDLTGAFLDEAPDGATPFVDGAEAAPPPGCADVTGQGLGTVPSPVSLVRSSRGLVVGAGAYRDSHEVHYHHGIDVEAGKDIAVMSIRAEPHGSGGWMRHKPVIGIVTKGTITYYQGGQGRCMKHEFTAGQAYVHASPVTMLPVNEGPEAFEAIYVFFNLPHNPQPLPVAGNLTDAIDWTPLPPHDCPRLR